MCDKNKQVLLFVDTIVNANIGSKRYITKNVYDAAIERINRVFDDFDNLYLSFSAGKDSTVLLHLFLKIAKERGFGKVPVLLIDLEAQYKATMEHAVEIMARDDVDPIWVCLPLNLRNAVSQYQPQWICWDPEEKDKWVRQYPEVPGVITDTNYFPFFKFAMEFEEFVIEFGNWFADGEKTACIVAIRSDESFNRYRTIKNKRKETFENLAWSTKVTDNVYNFYPIYDWRTEDVWTAIGKNNWCYNKIYDLMYLQGKSIHECRICQPYGDDQRAGLDLFRSCEPETWAKVVDRVSGANFGNIYCKSYLLGHRSVVLPEGHTWKSYTEFLLATIPQYEAEWYIEKFKVFEKWWEKHGYPVDKWSDAKLKKGDIRLVGPDGRVYTKGPSWERLAKCILKNDKLCKSLSFSQTKNQFRKYITMREMYGY